MPQTKTTGPTRKLAATLFMSLDGVVEEPQKWSFPYWNEEIGKFKLEETQASDALLLGRVTYQGFAAAWPSRKDDEGFADKFNSMPKYVASKTLTKLDWNNSHLIKGDVAAGVAKLKQEPGQEIVIHGGPTPLPFPMPPPPLHDYPLLAYPHPPRARRGPFERSAQATL